MRDIFPEAKLVIAGSARLYKKNQDIGSFGIGTPAFEKQYVLPIIEKFGSLKDAGITFTGLLSPQKLRELYSESALGIVNLNWHSFSETFCCSAVEMLATGLPVLGVAKGALPETIGPSGGVVLLDSSSDILIAQEMKDLLNSSKRLAQMGENGRDWVQKQYGLDHIVDCWDQILFADSSQLEKLSGPWKGSKGIRFRLESLVGIIGCGRILDVFLWLARRAKQLVRK